jgi:hypothetical protein
MENRLHSAILLQPTRYAANEELEDLHRKVCAVIDNAEASRWELLRVEWLYDFALLMNDFRLWMRHLDQGFDTDR